MAATRQNTSTKTSASGLLIVGAQGAVLASADSITITDSTHQVTGSTTINTILGGKAGQELRILNLSGATWKFGSGGNIKNTTATLPTDRAIWLFTPDGTTWYGRGDSVAVASANTDISVAESGGTYTLTFNPANVTLDEFAGPLALTKGGTGQTAKAAAFDALAPTTTRGDIVQMGAADNERLELGPSGTVLTSDGTDAVWSATISPTAILPVADTQTLVKGSADATKLVRVEADGITTGTTRVWTAPDRDLTVADTAAAQTFTGLQSFGSVKVDTTNGGTIDGILFGSSAVDLGSIAADSQAEFTVTVTGAAVGDPCFISHPDSSNKNQSWNCVVSAANTVTISCHNNEASEAYDPPSFTYQVVVFSIS